MLISTRVTYRNNMGQFMALCDAAAIKSAEELALVMNKRAKQRAPSGPPRLDYGRRAKLRPSIHPVIIGAKEWALIATAGHAGAIEHGAGPHIIPNGFGLGIPIEHPGNAAQPFMAPAIWAAKAQWKRILAKNYPG